MSNLITIQTNDNMEQVVSARELHEKLGIKERFSIWFGRAQKAFGMKEGFDYCRHTYTNANNQIFDDYLVSIDLAKHLCMISGGEKARTIRQYFIEVEKAWNSPEMVMSRALKLADRRILALEEERQKLLPKAEAYDTFMDGSNLQTMNDVAKCLGTGRNRLFELLRQKKIIRGNNTPYQEYIDRGYFEVKQKPIKMGDASINYAQTFVTAKGVDYIRKIIEKEKVPT